MKFSASNLLAGIACAAIAASFCTPAFAGDGQASAEKATELGNKARENFDAGIDAAKGGHFSDACNYFRNAASLADDANWATMGMRTDDSFDRKEVEAMGAALQELHDNAKSNADKVCGKTDDPS